MAVLDYQAVAKHQKSISEFDLNRLQNAICENGQLLDLRNLYEYSDAYLGQLMRKVNAYTNEFEFENSDTVENLIEAIILEAINQDKYNLGIKKTSDEQIVIFSKNKNNEYSNLAIDEDGDISYMFFANDKTKSKRKLYCFNDGLKVEELASLL